MTLNTHLLKISQSTMPPFRTINRQQLLGLLSITMLTPHILVEAGLVDDKTTQKLRSAQRLLRNLREAGYTSTQKYRTPKGFLTFHSLTRKFLREKGTPRQPYHRINEPLLTHDMLTAIFLAHLYRCSLENDFTLHWYPPFEIGGKFTDGGVVVRREGDVACSLLLEADTGSHDHREISEKLKQYVDFLVDHPQRRIVFLVIGEQRIRNIQQTLVDVLGDQADGQDRVHFLAPFQFPSDIDLFSLITREPADEVQGRGV